MAKRKKKKAKGLALVEELGLRWVEEDERIYVEARNELVDSLEEAGWEPEDEENADEEEQEALDSLVPAVMEEGYARPTREDVDAVPDEGMDEDEIESFFEDVDRGLDASEVSWRVVFSERAGKAIALVELGGDTFEHEIDGVKTLAEAAKAAHGIALEQAILIYETVV